MKMDRTYLGVMLMLGFCVIAPMGDAVAKLLGGRVPIGQLLLVRFAAQVILLIPLVWLSGSKLEATPRVLWLTLLRTSLHILGIGLMFTALIYLPLADAVAIAFVLPFIMLLLGHLVLKEEVGRKRLIACGVGFVGTLMVVQPAFEQVGWPALLPLGVALNFALFMLVTRQVAQKADPITLQAVSGAMAVLILAPPILLIPARFVPELAWTQPELSTWWLLGLLGLFGTLAHLLMTWSLKLAPSATLAPMQYLEIPMATVVGWLVFQEWPNSLAAVGILLTVSSGMFILMRERAIARALRTNPA